MRVLGITDSGNAYSRGDAYIVQITHAELAMVANKAGYSDKLEPLKVGQDYPIADGYCFRAEIVEAVRRMEEAHKHFAKATSTMTRFVRLIDTAEGASE